MSSQICEECGKLLQQGDMIYAEVVTKFVALRSKTIYALERPIECRYLEHVSCLNPKGDGLYE